MKQHTGHLKKVSPHHSECHGLIHLPSPPSKHDKQSRDYVLPELLQVADGFSFPAVLQFEVGGLADEGQMCWRAGLRVGEREREWGREGVRERTERVRVQHLRHPKFRKHWSRLSKSSHLHPFPTDRPQVTRTDPRSAETR